MARFEYSLAILMAVWCILSGSALAQASLGTPTSCPNAANMPNVNLQQFAGVWYEVARQPAPNNSQCVEIDFTSYPNNILNINLTSASNPNQLWKNSSMNVNITVEAGNSLGYAVTWPNQPQVTLKLLDTNYNGYAYICGYSVATDPSTYFGAILTRQRTPGAALLTYQTQASASYANFSTNAMTNITQSDQCYTVSGAATNVPAIATLFAFFFAILKYFN